MMPGEDGTGGGRSWPTLDGGTNVLVYLTGHGGDNFFKFQDGEELMSNDVASIFSQMYELKRYNEILFIADTCQAFTMAGKHHWVSLQFLLMQFISSVPLRCSLASPTCSPLFILPFPAVFVFDNLQMRFRCQMYSVSDRV